MVQTSLKHQEKPSEYLIYSPLLHIMTNRPPCRYIYLPGAELSKMVQSSADEDGAGLGLSKIVQRSAVTVDKEGTEGASATGAELVLLAGAFGDNVDLVLDRPFLFLVEDVVHRIPVLVGRVMNPLL